MTDAVLAPLQPAFLHVRDAELKLFQRACVVTCTVMAY
jgi:hypothetical protein